MAPTAMPAAIATTIAPATGQPLFTQSTPIKADANPLIEPTERSISPSISTQTMPSDMTPTVAQSKSRFTRLFGARKTGFRLEKTTEIRTRPTTTGSMPRSPERTRSTKLLSASATPSS